MVQSTNNIGYGHIFNIVTRKGTVISTSSVIHLADEERKEEQIIGLMEDFNNSVESKIGNYKKALIQGEEISNEIPYIDFISKDNIGINELIEFLERMNDDAIFSIPNSDNN